MIYPKKKKVSAQNGFDFTKLQGNGYQEMSTPSQSGIAPVRDIQPDKPPVKSGIGVGGWSAIAGAAGAAINGQQGYEENATDRKIDSGLKAAENIPIIGGFAKFGESASNAIEGDGESGARNAIGAHIGGGNTIKALSNGRFAEAIPVVGGFVKAKRIREENRKKQIEQNGIIAKGINERANVINNTAPRLRNMLYR